jgi:hypothetical protein
VILASGLELVREGTDVLDRSARTIADTAAAAPSDEPTASAPEDLVGAVLDLSAARVLVASGVRLIETARETDRRLLDVVA